MSQLKPCPFCGHVGLARKGAHTDCWFSAFCRECGGCLVTEVPPLGAYWPEQGGFYAGLVRNAHGADHHLIIGPSETEFDPAEWGEYGQDVPGATSKCDGMANTRAMAKAGSQIAIKALALGVNGFTDWHIPSQADLHVAFANCAEAFSKEGWYWSSTQGSRSGAFIQDFADGHSGWDTKDIE